MHTIGVLKEGERRRLVALAPAGVARLGVQVKVIVQKGAGRAAGFTDEAYLKAGAELVDGRADVMHRPISSWGTTVITGAKNWMVRRPSSASSTC